MQVLRFRKRVLFVVAALIWVLAGVNILHIGCKAWGREHLFWELFWLAVSLVFFSCFVFRKVVQRNIQALRLTKEKKLPLWQCMESKSWLVMALMMSLGIGLRLSGWVSSTFIGGFYVGLGISLIVSVWPYIRESFSNEPTS